MTADGKGLICKKCGEAIELDNVSPANLQFLHDRLNDGTLDEALTFSRVAWNNFPDLKISEQSKSMVEIMLKKVEEKVQNVLNPLQDTTKTLIGLSTSINTISASLPENVRKQVEEKMADILKELKSVQDSIPKSTEPITKQVEAMNQNFAQLMLKPTSKGQFAENTLTDAWQTNFTKDNITQLGGPGKPDLLVVPHLGTGAGEKISIERKSGQSYLREHVTQAVRHARENGARYVMVIYDNPEKLPDTMGSMSLETNDGMFVAVTEAQSGWKMSRYAFGIFQTALKTTETIDGVDMKELQAIVNEMNDYQQKINELRKKNASTIKAAEASAKMIDALEKDFGRYLDRIQLALNPQRQGEN